MAESDVKEFLGACSRVEEGPDDCAVSWVGGELAELFDLFSSKAGDFWDDVTCVDPADEGWVDLVVAEEPFVEFSEDDFEVSFD